jgi:hypothetical protein
MDGTRPFQHLRESGKTARSQAGMPSRTRGAAVYTGRVDEIIKVCLRIAGHYGGPTRIIFRERGGVCISR